MRFPPERSRRRPVAAAPIAVLVAAAVCGCGKANLVPRPAHTQSRTPRALEPGKPARAPRAGSAEAVEVPLPLTAARADGFARAVALTAADLPGAAPSPRSRTPRSEQQEAAKCGARHTQAVGGGRSSDYQRGRGLDRESISSGVDVLTDAVAVRSDLAYAASQAGLACYAKVLGKSLRREASANVRLFGVRVDHLGLDLAAAGHASGIRITARVGVPGAPVQVRLFVDALSLPYGPAELDLYTTSFVQPVPERTQRELLGLLRERARRHAL